MKKAFDLIVIGGGASGFMGAITASGEGVNSVVVLESTSKTLEKVRISGGGRCNVTNACWEAKELVQNYPRGEKPLLGAFSLFSTSDAIAWFEEKGLALVAEKDGRIFPKSNSSADVIDCLKKNAIENKVEVLTNMRVERIKPLEENIFKIECKNKQPIYGRKVLIATGGSPSGRLISGSLGHEIIEVVPSLFTFKINSQWLTACKGISVSNVNLKINLSNKVFEEYGNILITHWGLSGPAILRLSAFSARQLKESNYNFELKIKWVNENMEKIKDSLLYFKKCFPGDKIQKNYPYTKIPRRLWVSMLTSININPQITWANLSKNHLKSMCNLLLDNSHMVTARGPFGEEFVTAGGVRLSEVNFKTMESRICKGIYFSGELLNIDGITGGFNFQHCWTSGWIAGKSIANSLLK